jgi:hypothetical protein
LAALSPEISGLQYSLREGVTKVEGRYGKLYPINSPLIPAPHTPRGGWGVVFYMHGQGTRVNGATAQLVFQRAYDFFVLNNTVVIPIDLWFNLNIQWVEQAIEKYQNVSLESLLELGSKNFEL